MDSLVRYELDGGVATVTMDDGKVNALSLAMQAELRAAFDRAESDGAVVVLAGREGRFSAGFDLAVLTAAGVDAADMLRGGFELSHRMLSFPRPVVVACTGHAIAMGVFLVLSGDYRIGVASDDVKVTANEVAIGMPLPRAAIEVCRQRLTPAGLTRALLLAEVFTPAAAIQCGFLDRTVPAGEVVAEAQRTAAAFASLSENAHRATKLREREATLAALQAALEADDADFRAAVGGR